MPSELYIVEIGLVKGQRKARRHVLRVPLDVATGNYHRLADRTLNDLIKDMRHEQRRRAGELFDGQEPQRQRNHRLRPEPPKPAGFDPFSAIITEEES